MSTPPKLTFGHGTPLPSRLGYIYRWRNSNHYGRVFETNSGECRPGLSWNAFDEIQLRQTVFVIKMPQVQWTVITDRHQVTLHNIIIITSSSSSS